MLEDVFRSLVGAIIAASLLALIWRLVQWWRRQMVVARQALPDHRGAPLRLRGQAPDYPPFWRVGWLDPTTGAFRPRGFWGLPQTLAATRTQEPRAAAPDDALPPFATYDSVLVCLDPAGAVFLLAGDPEEVRVAANTVAASGTARPPVGRWRWLRTNTPFFGFVAVVVALLWTVWSLLPLLGAGPVDVVNEVLVGTLLGLHVLLLAAMCIGFPLWAQRRVSRLAAEIDPL